MASLAMPRSRTVPAAVRYAAVAVVGATVLAVSAYYLYKLAEAINMPVGLAWSLPVALEAGAATGSLWWLMSDKGTAVRRLACGLTLSCLAASLLGNALSHLIDNDLLKVTVLLVIGVSSVYPAVFWAIVHLVTLDSAPAELVDDASPAAEDASKPAEDASPMYQAPAVEPVVMHHPTVEAVAEPTVEAVPAPSGEPSGDDGEPSAGRRGGRKPSTAEQRRRWIDAQLDKGRELTGGDVERRFGSRNGARELGQVLAGRAGVAGGEVA